MSETNEDITSQPADGPGRRDITNEPPRDAGAYEPEQFAPPPKKKTWLFVIVAVGHPRFVELLCTLTRPFDLSRRCQGTSVGRSAQSQNNCKQMTLALNNIATNTTTGSIPPSYGPFPVGSTIPQSFFVSLLPYIEQNYLYMTWAANSNTPVKTYIAPADVNNFGTSGLISYGSNGTLLMQNNAAPMFPKSFGGRTSSVIVVFERTAKSGATWRSSNSYLIDKNGSSSPEFSGSDSWSSYGTTATALTSTGCVVGMGDGSARVVTESSASAGWAWAMDPSINSGQPAGW